LNIWRKSLLVIEGSLDSDKNKGYLTWRLMYMSAGTLRLPWLKFIRAFSFNCKANARIFLAKTGRGPHSS
jgi:hypothetical protein